MSEKMQIIIEVDAASGVVSLGEVEKGLKGVEEQSIKSSSSVDKFAGSLGSIITAGAVIATVKGIAEAGLELDSIMARLSIGSKNAADEFNFISATSQRLGVNLKESALQYSSLAAAARGTALEGQGVRNVFEGIATAAAAMHMNNEQISGSLTALQQMISKGKVSAEELNGQLGERMPGALALAARAMDMTTQELMKQMQNGNLYATDFLPKLAEELKKTYGQAAVESADSARANFNRLENAIFDLKTQMASGGVIEALGDITKGMTWVADNGIKPMIFGIKAMGVSVGEGMEKLSILAEWMTSPSKWFLPGAAKVWRDHMEERWKIAGEVADAELTRIAGKMNQTGGVIPAAESPNAPTAPAATGPTAADKAAAKRAESALQTELDKLQRIHDASVQADLKGEELVKAKEQRDLDAMQRDYERAIKAGADKSKLDEAYHQARIDRERMADAEIAKLREEHDKQVTQAVIAQQIAQSSITQASITLDRDMKISQLETDKALQVARGTWSLEQEATFQQQRGEIELSGLDAIAQAKADREALRYEQELIKEDERRARIIENQLWDAEQQAAHDEFMRLKAQEHADNMARIELEKANTKAQIDAKVAAADRAGKSEMALFTEAINKRDLSGALDHGEKALKTASTQSKEMFALHKAMALAKATVAGYEAVQSAYAHGATWGGPVGGAIEAAVALAFTATQLSSIASASYGGAGSGGASMGSSTAPSGTPTTAPPPIATQQPQQNQSASLTINVSAPQGLVDPIVAQQLADSLAPHLNDALRRGLNTSMVI